MDEHAFPPTGYVSLYKYLIVSLVFSHLGFWSGNLFLIAPFPDLCLLVPFCGLARLHDTIIIGIHLHTPVLLYKSGVQVGMHVTEMISCCKWVPIWI